MSSPRSGLFARPLDTLRRDLRAATAGLRGRQPPPFQPRDGSAWPRVQAPLVGREAEVIQVERLGPDAARLWLQPTDGGALPFRAGQFLTVSLDIDGVEQRRAYSLCSDPARPERVAIAVRRLPDGRVSPLLVDGLQPGARLRVLGPSGAYGHAIEPDAARHHVFVSGGSGITPHVALVHAVLEHEPRSRCTLVLGDRDAERLMLRADLEALALAHPDRVAVRLVVEQPPRGWKGGRGRLDAAGLAAQLAKLGIQDDPLTRWYLCGPEAMLDALLPWLREQGVSEARIAVERFRAAPAALPEEATQTAWRVAVRAEGWSRTVVVPPGQTILEAARASGLDLPHSCAMGGCGACRLRLASGRVAMRKPNCLGSDEAADGIVLTCVAHPLEAVVLEPL